MLLHFVSCNIICCRDPRGPGLLVRPLQSQLNCPLHAVVFSAGVPADLSRIRGSVPALITLPDTRSFQSWGAASSQSTASVKSVQSLGCLFIPTLFSSLCALWKKGKILLILKCIDCRTPFIFNSCHLCGHHDILPRCFQHKQWSLTEENIRVIKTVIHSLPAQPSVEITRL